MYRRGSDGQISTDVTFVDRSGLTDDERIRSIKPLPRPARYLQRLPIRGTAAEGLIHATRRKIGSIINGCDDRLLVIIGPCSIHDPVAAFEYARSLREERLHFLPQLEIVMRVYFEKPRTAIGWKGLINDPGLDESFRIEEGLSIARQLLIDINALGVPAGGEFLDVISPQYLGDLMSWGAIGARTTESQVHRQLASGLSAPIGFKNGTDGNIAVAADAVRSAAQPYHFLSVLKSGQVAIVETDGNRDCHVILRGGERPNYDRESVERACAELERRQLQGRVMVDFSHGNSGKQYDRQIEVARDVAAQIANGSTKLLGAMIEVISEQVRKRWVLVRTDLRVSSMVKASRTLASAGKSR